MLRLRTHFTLDDFEDGANYIALGENNIMVPNKIKANAVGGLAALIQLIITWSRTNREKGKLKIYATDYSGESIERFARTPFGLISLIMAHEINFVNGDAVNRTAALEKSREYVVAMHEGSLKYLRNISKTTIPIICIDSAREFRRPRRLYIPGSDKVRDLGDFQNLLHECADAILPLHRRLDRTREIYPAASLLFEAFQNTDDHAQVDFRGDRFRRSVRGVLVGYQYVEISALKEMAGAHEPLQRYFQHWRPDRPNARHAQFLELSVFDSGSGLAQKWLGKRDEDFSGIREGGVPLSAEYRAVIECLRKGGTTKGGDTSGNGLFRIMQVVKRAGGFIRIRTGRTALIKAFGVDPHARPSEEDLMMEDAMIGGIPCVPRPWADGTVITVLLPLNRSIAS